MRFLVLSVISLIALANLIVGSSEPAAPTLSVAVATDPEPSALAPAPTFGKQPSATGRADGARRGEVLYVSASALRLRSGPGTNHSIVAKMPRGEAVELTGETQGRWVAVRRSGGVVGWSHGDYLSKTRRNEVKVAKRKAKPAAPQRAAKLSKPRLSDRQISERIINASIRGYSGSCPCPYNRDRAGRRCGKRSAWSRPGGASPICFESDVSASMISRWRGRNGG